MTAEVKVEEKQVETEVAVAPQEETVKVVEEETVKDVDGEVKDKSIDTDAVDEANKHKTMEKSTSFKEESNFLSDLKESERKALSDLKSKLEEAIVGNTLFKKEEPKKKEGPVKKEPKKEAEEEKKKAEEKKETEDKAPEEKQEEKIEEEKKTEAVVTEEEKQDDTPEQKAVATEEEKQEEKIEEEKKTEAVVTEEGKEDETPEEKAVVTEEEKKTEAVVTEEVRAETEEERKKAKEEEEEEIVDKDISLWNVPLLPSKGAEATDVILLKFLRARDFKVNEAFEMLKRTLIWRKETKIDSILEEDFGADLNSAAYMNGVDREGHPVCYNIHGVFENEELYQKTFGTEENKEKFLRWRFQLMEKGIQKLDLKPGGVTSLLQINDLKNSPGLSRKELRGAMKQAIVALQDNYPEFVARNIFINVPFWFYALNTLLSPFLTQRTKSKFVVARPAKVTETLLKYIPAEEIPVQYGGFKRDNDLEFSNEQAAVAAISEVIVKPGTAETIEIPATEVGATVVWDVTVLGWEVNYKEEFVPADEGSYTVIVQKSKKMGSTDGPIRNSFRNSEPGKIVLTVDNVSGKKKRVLYRFTTKIGSSC